MELLCTIYSPRNALYQKVQDVNKLSMFHQISGGINWIAFKHKLGENDINFGLF